MVRVPELLGLPEEKLAGPEHAAEGLSWWDAPYSRTVISLALDAYGPAGTLDARKAAAVAGVTPGSVRRWARKGLPLARRKPFWDVLAVSDLVHDQERTQHALAIEGNATLHLKGVKATEWRSRGWDQPHVLYVVWFPKLGVWIPRTGALSEKTLSRITAGAGGGRILARHIFPNYFAAQSARFQLLEDSAPWRVSIPALESVEGTGRLQGKSAAVLSGAGVPALSPYEKVKAS